MNQILTNFFLKLQAWKLFTIIFLLIIVFLLISQPLTENYVNSDAYPKYSIALSSLLTFCFHLILFSWFWVLGIELNNRIEGSIRPNSTFFKIGIILCVFQQLISLIDLILNSQLTNKEYFFEVFFLLNAFSIFFKFYAFFFVAKNLIRAEKSQLAIHNNMILTLILFLLFFPIGIWFLQKRINLLFSFEYELAENSGDMLSENSGDML